MAKCAHVPNIKSKEGKSVPSILFRTLLGETRKRYKTIELWSVLTSDAYRTKYPNLIEDENGEPQLFAGLVVKTADGKEIQIMDSSKEFVSPFRSGIIRKMREDLVKIIGGIPEAIRNGLSNMGMDRMLNGRSWKKTKKGLIDLQSVYGVELDSASSGVKTFAYLFDRFLYADDKKKMLEAYGKKMIQGLSREEIENLKYQMTLDYIAWKRVGIRNKSHTNQTFAQLEQVFDNLYQNSLMLNDFFEKIDRGFYTMGIPTNEFIVNTADSILRIQKDFGDESSSLLDAVERFRLASMQIRNSMRTRMYTVNFKSVDGKAMYYFPTRNEAERGMKAMLEADYDQAEKAMMERFKTLVPDLADRTSEELALVKRYNNIKAIYENFDKVINILYPTKMRRDIDQYEELMIEESGEEVNLNAETIGSENFNSEAATSAPVKDFLATIRRGDGSFIRPRAAYLIAGRLLSGVDERGDLFESKGQVIHKAKLMGGPGSDAWYVANALSDLFTAGYSRSLHIGKNRKPVGDPGGSFHGYNYFVFVGGEVERRPNESTPAFYLRIEKESGLTNSQIALAGQMFVNTDLFNTIYSHFASLKEANYHFLETEEKSFARTTRYRPSKQTAVNTTIRENVLDKIHESLENGTFDAAYETAMKEDITEEQAKSLGGEGSKIATNDTYRYLLRIERFLRELGLNSEANFFTISTSPVKNALNSVDERRLEIIRAEAVLVDSIYKDLVYGTERAQATLEDHKANLKKYEDVQKAYEELDVEERTKALDRVYAVFRNIENGIYSKPLKEDSTPDESVIVLKDLTPTEMIVFRAKELRVRPSLNVRNDINSFLDHLAELVNRNNDNQRPTSFFSKDKSKKYSLHNASNSWVVVNDMLSHNLATPENRAVAMGRKHPYLRLEFYRQNIFMKGMNKIHAWHDFDYTKSIDYKGSVDSLTYGDERFREFFNRVLNGQFFDWVAFKGRENPRYVQSIPTISNRPTTFGVEVDLKARKEIVEGLANTIRQLKSRNKNLRVQGYNPESTVNFRILDNFLGAKKKGDTHTRYPSISEIPDEAINGIAATMYDVYLKDAALELARRMVDMKVPLHKNMVSEGLKNVVDIKDLEKLEALKNSGNETRALKKVGDRIESVFKAEELLPVMHVFVANNYLNSYHVQQLILGDQAFFKNGADVVKRSGGAHAPGQRGRVHNRLGMPEKYRALVVSDPVVDSGGMRATLERLGFEGTELEELMELYPGKYEPFDGFGVATPKRRRDIVRGFGSSYGVTNILKPAHYEIDETGVPRMLKYSSLVLTDELCAKFDKLRVLRQNLYAMGMDEMVFTSVVKVGIPEEGSLLSLDELTDSDNLWESDEKIDDEGHVYYDGFKRKTDEGFKKLDENSVLTLSNYNYRLQHNPHHSLDSSVANPTQLSYFLNVLTKNPVAATRVYTAMANLTKRRMDRVLESGESGITQYLLESLQGKGNERLLELLEAGISVQNPMIEKESYTKLSAMFRKEIIQTRFQGQKMVAQSDMGISSMRFEDGRLVESYNPLKLDIIEKNGTKRYVAETVLPKGALPKEIEDSIIKRLQNNEEVFLTAGDALAFRIPSSELHSAVSLRVVGFVDPVKLEGVLIDTNMIILPHQLIPVIGHDFDIDSFFVLQRQQAARKDGSKYFPGYTRTRNGYVFNFEMNVKDLSDAEYEAYYKNMILETFLETVEAPDRNRRRMLSPISFVPIKKDIDAIQTLMGTKGKDLDLSDPNQNYDAFESSFSGAKGVGIIANAMKSLAYSIRSNNGKAPAVNLKERFGKKIVTLSAEGETLNEIKEREEDKVNLWMSLDGLLNAAVDNVKEQILPQLNIGDNTFKAYIAGRALGVRMEVVNRFMVQPFMRNLSSFNSQGQINKALDELTDAAAKLMEAEGITMPDTVDLNIKDLEKWLTYAKKKKINTISDILATGDKEFILAQANLAVAYRQLTMVGNSISDLSRYLSIIRELPVTAPDMERLMEVRSKIFNEDGTLNENFRLVIPDFMKENPHIKILDEVLMDFYSRTRTMFEIHSPQVEALIEEVLGNIQRSENREETAQMLKEEYEKFILQMVEDVPQFKWDPDFIGYDNMPAAFNPKLGEELSGKEAFTFHVVSMVNELKKEFPGNKFLSALSSTIEYNGASIQMHGVHNMEFQDHLEMRYYFLQLNGLSYNYETGKVERVDPSFTFSQVQKDLLRFAMLKYGLKFGTKNFALGFPPELIKMVDEQYVKAISSYDWKINGFSDFALQAVMVNPDLTRVNMEKASWRGYDASTRMHYDMKISKPNAPTIIKKDNEFARRLSSTYYLNVSPPGANESYYQEIGKADKTRFYNAPSGIPLYERFRGDIKHFKVSQIETNEKNEVVIRDTYTKNVPHSGIEKGSVISVSTYSDPLRTDKKYLKVTSLEEGIIRGKETKRVPELDTSKVLNARPYNIKDENSDDYRRLEKTLKRLSGRTGIAYEIVNSSRMEELTSNADDKGAFVRNTEFPDGKVYINYSTLSPDTPFHEFIHPFIHAVKLQNKPLYKALVKEMKADLYGKQILEKIKAKYQDYSPESDTQIDQEEEALVTLVGEYAVRSHEMSVRTSLRKLLIRLLENISAHVKSLLGKDKVVTPENIGKVTLSDLGLLFGVGGSKISSYGSSELKAESRKIDELVTDSEKATVTMDESGVEADKYTMQDGTERDRVSNFIKNFINRKISDSKSIALRRADKIWKDTSHDVKLDTDLVNQEAMTYDEYVAKVEKMMEKGRIKGKLLHKKIQMLLHPEKKDQIEAEMEEINKGDIVSKWEYQWVEERIDELLSMYGININPELPEESRDSVQSEVTVESELLGVAGTIDTMVEHPDGKFSLIEWKSGRMFNDKIFDNLMKYGSQRVDISDNSKERAKLQVALYAVIMRIKHPEIEFRDLQVAWIPNEFQAMRENPTRFVEVDSYIPMIEAFFKDQEALKAAGIPTDIIEKINPKGDLFRVSAYSSYSSSSINDMLEQGRNLDNILEIKLNRLQAIQAKLDAEGIELKDLEKEEREEYLKLTEEILELEKDPEMILKGSLDRQGDIGMWTRWFGNAADVNNPLVAVWNKVRNQRALEAERAYRGKMNIFRALLEPVMKEVKKETGFVEIRKAGVMTGNYKEMFDWAYKYDEIPGRGRVRRFVTKDDAEFNGPKMTEAKKALLNYLNDTVSSYFIGNEAYLNQVVMEVDGKKGTKERLSHLDVMNRFTAEKDKLKLFYGFMPKVQQSMAEYMYKQGEDSLFRGAFSLSNIKREWRRAMSFYEERNYERWDVNQQALPIKFTGSPEIEATGEYTENLEVIFSRWVQHMEHKKHMDHVYVLGRGVYNTLLEKPEKERLSNVANMLDDLLVKDVQGRMKKSKYTSKTFLVKTPGKKGEEWEWNDHGVSFDKVLMFLNKWGSSVIMQFRPFTAAGNTIHGAIIQGRRAAVGSIMKLTGTEGELLDYTTSDLANAEVDYGKLLMDAAEGKIRENKLYMIAKELNFHPNASIYSMDREFISVRNRILDESTKYIAHTIGEEYLAYIILAAQMHHVKLPNGKSLYEAYDVEKGTHGEPKLVWKGGIRGYVRHGSGSLTREIPLEGLTAQEGARMKRIYELQQGSYRREELAAMEVYALGKMFTGLKRYLHRLLFVQAQSRKADYSQGFYHKVDSRKEGDQEIPIYELRARMVEGRFAVLAKAMLSVVTAGNAYNEYLWKNLSIEDKQALIDAMLTAAMYGAAVTAYHAMFDDDDDSNTIKKFWKRYLVDNPTQHWNPVDVLRNPGQLVPVGITRLSVSAQATAKMMTALALYSVTGDMDHLITQRGQLRGWNDFKKGVPYVAPVTDFIDKMRNQDLFPWYEDDNRYRR